MSFPITISLGDPSQIGQARRAAAELAASVGLDETQRGKAGIVATELAGNVIKHARQGELLLRGLEGAAGPGIELIAMDSGPGMADVSECLRDGFSTAGSPGTGLGAVSRLSSAFDIYTHPGSGTVLMAQIRARSSSNGREGAITGAVCVPKMGEECSGDAFAIFHENARLLIVVADGLGHGIEAARAAHEALRTAGEHRSRSPGEMLRLMQGPLRNTRGASVAVAEVKPSAGTVRYAAVGNIAATILTMGGSRSLISHNGTVGHEVHRVQEFAYPWTDGSLLVMHSDGLQNRWSLDNYPGLRLRHPSVIAAVLYRDFRRRNDDTTVVALRE